MGRAPNESELSEPELKPLIQSHKTALGRQLKATRSKPLSEDKVEGICMAVNSTGNTLVMGGPQSFLQVIDTSSLEQMSTIDLEASKAAEGGGHSKRSYGLKEVSVTTALRYIPHPSQPNPSLLLAAHGSRLLQIHVSTGKVISTIDEESNKISNVKCRSDGKAFVTCGSDCLLRVYSGEDGGKAGPTATLRNGDGVNAAGHNNQVFGLVWHPDDPNVILSAGWDKTVLIWDLRVGKSIRSIFGSYVCGDSLDVKGNKILIGSWRHQSPLELWDLSSCKLLTRLPWTQPVMDACRPYAAKFGTGAMQGYIMAGGSGKCPVVRLYSEATSELLGSMVTPSAVHSLDTATKGTPAPIGMNGSPSYSPGTDKMRFVAACCAKELCILEM
jgi:WD40 repeat protein